MNKNFMKLTRRCLALSMLGMLSVAASAQSWVTVGSEGFAASGLGVSNWQKLKINQYNELYLAYNDEGFGLTAGQATVMKYDGNSWVPVGSPGFTAGAAQHSDFTFGNGDTLYFSYSNGTGANMSKAAVMMFDGSTWSPIGTDISLGAAQYTNIVYTSTGELYLGMIDMGIAGGSMSVKRYTGGSNWVDVGASPVAGGASCAYASMALDKFDTLYVAYRDNTIAPGMVKVRKFDGTDWVDVGAPLLATTGPGAGPAMDIYLAFDLLNQPYVSYSHTFQGPPRITVERFDGTAWQPVGPVQFSSAQFETSLFSSLSLPKDAPYVAYQHGGLGLKASVKKYNSQTQDWDFVGSPGISDGVAAHTSVTMDGNGNLYLAYFDEVHGSKNTVKKYTLCEAPMMEEIIALDTPLCNGPVTLKVMGSLNDATNWEWYSGSCIGGTFVAQGDSIVVDPSVSTTYYVKGLGGCVTSGACLSVRVNVAIEKPEISLNGNVFSSSAPSGNQWYHNGNPVSGATGASHTATAAGWYYTVVTEGNCSRASDSLFYDGLSVRGIDQQLGIHVYPLPFREALHVDFEQSAQAQAGWQLSIVDYAGRIVKQELLTEAQNVINVANLAAGAYYIKLQAGQDKAVFKIVKQ